MLHSIQNRVARMIWSIMVTWYHPRYRRTTASVLRLSKRRNKDFRFGRRGSRLSEVSNDRGNEVRRARDYVTTPYIGCPLVSPPEKESAGRLPRLLLPLKLIRSIYVYHLLKFMRTFSCISCAKYYRERPKTIGCPLNHTFLCLFPVRIRFVF